jgi:uncharacterized lipoprotein
MKTMRRKPVAAALLMVLAAVSVAPAATQATGTKSEIILGFEKLTAPATSTGLTLPSGARHALISVAGGAVFVGSNAHVPTNATGLYLAAGSVLKIDNDPAYLTSLRFICKSGDTCNVYALYSRERRVTE